MGLFGNNLKNRMFIFGLLILSILLFSSFGFAQDKGLSSIGVKGGFSASSPSHDDGFVNLDSRNGFSAGVFAAFNLNQNIIFEPELLYTVKGYKYSESFGDGDINMSYIEIPLLLKYQVPTSSSISPNFYIGPSFSFLTKAEAKFEPPDGSDKITEDVKDSFESTDIGIIFGGGLDIMVGSGKLIVEARYNLGLSDVAIEGELNNRAVSFMIGYAFSL